MRGQLALKIQQEKHPESPDKLVTVVVDGSHITITPPSVPHGNNPQTGQKLADSYVSHKTGTKNKRCVNIVVTIILTQAALNT